MALFVRYESEMQETENGSYKSSEINSKRTTVIVLTGRDSMRKNNRKRIISTVIVGAMLCAGAAFGTVKYMNRDTGGSESTGTSETAVSDKSGDVADAEQTVYMTDFQKENAQKEKEIVADKVEDK